MAEIKLLVSCHRPFPVPEHPLLKQNCPTASRGPLPRSFWTGWAMIGFQI